MHLPVGLGPGFARVFFVFAPFSATVSQMPQCGGAFRSGIRRLI
jgi:hypothetical protein